MLILNNFKNPFQADLNRSQHENKKTKVITAVTQVGSFLLTSPYCLQFKILHSSYNLILHRIINAMCLSLYESQLKMKDRDLDAKVENDNDLYRACHFLCHVDVL